MPNWISSDPRPWLCDMRGTPAISIQVDARLAPGTEPNGKPDRLAGLTNEPVTTANNGRQGSFVLALRADDAERLTKVHADRNRWSAIVYLSRPEDCEGGTAWYRHRVSGNSRETADWMTKIFGHLAGRPRAEIVDAMLATSRDLSQWIEVQYVPMVYNRCVLFLAEEFHAVVSPFGDRPEDGRLVQSFEFYAPGDEG